MAFSRRSPILGFLALAVAYAPLVFAQCPTKAGYVAKADTNWVRSDKTTESQTQPASAEQICNLDRNCLAFNSFGYYILKKGDVAPTIDAAGIKLQPYTGLCTYIKASALPTCTDKAGYVTKTNTNWVGSGQTSESQTQPGSAEQICNLDNNCLAFNSFGYYILKRSDVAPTIDAAGIKFQPYDKMCTYVKASAEQTGPPPARQSVFRNLASKLCFAVKEDQRLPLGLPRLLLSPCSSSDKTQGFKVVATGNAYQLVDNKGRCVTTYFGLLVRSAGLMSCGNNRADQLWVLESRSPNGNGPYSIKNRDSNTCIRNSGNAVTLQSCNPADSNAVFETMYM